MVALTSDHVGTNPIVTSEWPALTSTMEASNPLTMIEWKYPLHLTYSSELLTLTFDLLVRKAVALTFDHVGPHPIVTLKWPALTSDLLVRKAIAFTFM